MLDELGVEAGVGVSLDLGDGLGLGDGGVARDEPVVVVGDRDDARRGGDAVAARAGGEARPVVALVMVHDSADDVLAPRQVAEHARAEERVVLGGGLLVGVALLGAEGPGDGGLADIVEQGADSEVLDLRLAPFHLTCEGARGGGDAPGVGCERRVEHADGAGHKLEDLVGGVPGG